jgi:phage-related tail protein
MKLRCLIVLICLSGYVFGQEKVNYYEKYRDFKNACDELTDTIFTDELATELGTITGLNLFLLEERHLTVIRSFLREFDELAHNLAINVLNTLTYMEFYYVLYEQYTTDINKVNMYINNIPLETEITRINKQIKEYHKLAEVYNKRIVDWWVYYTLNERHNGRNCPFPEKVYFLPFPTNN